MIDFYTLLAFLMFCLVSFNFFLIKRKTLGFFSGGIALYYVLLRTVPLLLYSSMAWAIFNILVAIVVLVTSNDLTYEYRKNIKND